MMTHPKGQNAQREPAAVMIGVRRMRIHCFVAGAGLESRRAGDPAGGGSRLLA
jgi:hypothetical protein